MASKQRDPAAVFLAVVAETVGVIVTDIRSELVERAWIGREATPSPDISIVEASGWELPSMEQKAAAWDALCCHLARERGWAEPDHDRGHDHDHEL